MGVRRAHPLTLAAKLGQGVLLSNVTRPVVVYWSQPDSLLPKAICVTVWTLCEDDLMTEVHGVRVGVRAACTCRGVVSGMPRVIDWIAQQQGGLLAD